MTGVVNENDFWGVNTYVVDKEGKVSKSTDKSLETEIVATDSVATDSTSVTSIDSVYHEGFVLLTELDTTHTDDIEILPLGKEMSLTYFTDNITIDSVEFKLTIKPEGDNADVLYPSNGWKKYLKNSPWVLKPDKEGKFIAEWRAGDKNGKLEFWVRPKVYDFACKVCGRDLEITHDKLKSLFPGSEAIEDNSITEDYFKLAITKAELNTCYRQAHFFSQIAHESNGMVASEEGTNYSLANMLNTFSKSSNAKEVFYKQSFWDDEDYLDYANINLYETTSLLDFNVGKYKSTGESTYKWNNNESYKVKIKTDFSSDNSGGFKKHSQTSSETLSNGKRLLNLIYANGVGFGNGDVASGDGYKYRGRGAIMLTGKGNYKAVSDKCNELFGTSYNWQANPDEVKENLKARILSASAYIINRFGTISKLDTECTNQSDYDGCVRPVTKLVNGGTIGLGDRKKRFKNMIEGMYKNCKAKK